MRRPLSWPGPASPRSPRCALLLGGALVLGACRSEVSVSGKGPSPGGGAFAVLPEARKSAVPGAELGPVSYEGTLPDGGLLRVSVLESGDVWATLTGATRGTALGQFADGQVRLQAQPTAEAPLVGTVHLREVGAQLVGTAALRMYGAPDERSDTARVPVTLSRTSAAP
jgi:hypothetical protein